jgi:hypothetical protein
MVTLEEIKKRYPKGCEVSCAYNNDKAMVNHDSLEKNQTGDIWFIENKNGNLIYLFWKFKNKFSTITKPASESKQDKPKRYKEKEVDGMDVIDLAKYWSLNFNEGNILKYLLRDKGQDADDMQKIADYAQRENEYLNNKNK